MNAKRWTGRVQVAVAACALLGAVGLVGCKDLMNPQRAPIEAIETLELTTPGIHPVLVVTNRSADAVTVELQLRRVEVADRIASFQGELRFDTERLALEGADVPAGITGAWNEVEPGVLRFAGIAVEGVDDGSVLSLSFSLSGRVTPDHFELSMEELVASEGFRDLAPAIQRPERRVNLVFSQPE